ncbi:MAG: methionine gamma-lyase family protein, partial [Succiniclasticum sp.]
MRSGKDINYDFIFDFARKEVDKQKHYYDAVALKNTEKVIAVFRKHQVSDFYMKPTTGYAYNDLGREKLDAIYADIFGAEAALVRSQFVSGTHALAVAMFGNLRPGDEVIGATGTPYDTMQTIIGHPKKTPGSLVDLGIIYKEIPMSGNYVDIHAVCSAITDKTKMVHIQRSCGYSDDRGTLDVASIGRLIQEIHKVRNDIICFVDNCYGEFTEDKEPTDVGADLMAGSLIKNLGGGLAPTGGYIVGRKELVYNAACRLTAPGLAGEMGATLGGDTAREFYQGLFMAPHVVMQAVKTAVYAAAVFRKLGYKVKPLQDEIRHDIIQSITLKT